ncbi:STAS domain-containing protein [Streptomyces sp. SP18CS02]|uniref:STAS domain-containing protein n=1 Tax=Streptomyces sp. SP18CS02 TaxID=3002531 RepID=UPI002E75C527|nr:STAS domain-containing protein [Streptomyces sp. SP18CS02]
MEPDDVPGLCAGLGAALDGAGDREVVCDVGGVVRPGLAVVDALARLMLTARRAGCRFRVRGAGPELRVLIGLVGLAGRFDPPVPPDALTPPGGPEERTAGTSASCPGRSPSRRPCRPRSPGR